MKKEYINKIIIVVLLIGVIAAFKIFNLGDYLTLSYIKESQEKFQAIYSEKGITVIAGYMLIYIAVTALSLPGAAIMTQWQ